MMESGIPICNTCGEQVGLNSKGEVFVACNECNYPICQHCLNYEIKEGRTACIRCATPYAEGTTLSILLLLNIHLITALMHVFIMSKLRSECCHVSHFFSLKIYVLYIKHSRFECIEWTDGAAVAEESGNHIPTIHTSQARSIIIFFVKLKKLLSDCYLFQCFIGIPIYA